MTERDAFGNEIPDPAAPSTQPVTGGDPPAPSPTPAPATPRPVWWARGLGLLVTLAFVAPFAIGGWVAWNAFHAAETATSVIKSVRDFTATTTTADDHGDHRSAPAEPTGVTGASMLAARNLDRALAEARRDPGGRLGLLRLAPARADLQLARHGGGMDLLQLRHDGGRSLVRTPGTAPRKAIIFSRVDRAAPSRLVRQAAHRLGRSTKAIDYVVLIDVLDGPRWSAYFKGGAAFQGDAHGHVTRRIQ